MASIYVRNLKPTTSDDSFFSYFRSTCAGVLPGSEAGKIIRKDGRCLYGFVNFIDAASANRAIAKKNHVIDGNKLVCRIKSKKKAPSAPNKIREKSEPQYLRELYIGNVNVSTTKQELKEYFQKFGYVEDAYLIMDENKRSKGFGFVQFQKSSSLDNVQDKRPHIINNKTVQTVRSYPKGIPAHLKKPATVLFVSQYNENVTEDDIDDYFSEYGNITGVSTNKKKRTDGQEDFKYIKLEFEDYDAVDKICLEDFITNHTINGCRLKVTKCLEDNFDEKQGDKNQTQNAPKSAGNSARNAENWSSIGISSTPVPSAPLFPAEDLNSSPYNPYFVNNQPPPCQSLPTQQMNPQPRPVDRSFVSGQSNLYPALGPNRANPQRTQSYVAPSHSRTTQRRQNSADCVIL